MAIGYIILIVVGGFAAVAAIGVGVAFGKRRKEKKEIEAKKGAVAVEEEKEIETERAYSLKEIFALAKSAEGKNGLDKKRIAAHIKEKFGERAEVNERENFTSTGLPLADTHFVVKDGKRKCFLYVYEGNSVLILLNTAEGNCEELAKRHKNVVRSAFPKSKDSWYAVVMDGTIGQEEALAIIDKAAEESLRKL